MKLLLIICLLANSVMADDAKYLRKGEPAPFDGFILTPEKAEKVRENAIDLETTKKINLGLSQERDLLQQRIDHANKHIDSLSKQVVDARHSNRLVEISAFILGSVLTGAVAYGLAKTIR